MKNSCRNCTYAIITLVAECTKRGSDGEYFYEGGMCPEELICPFWEQATEDEIAANSIDWTKARGIYID